MEEEKKTLQQLQVHIDDEIAQGVYTNLVMINHTDNEFILDFLFVQPQQPKAKVRARVIASPRHTKRIMLALRENMAKYEEKHGAIDIAGPHGPPLH